jgi:type IX secretion system PorP/SprF family membrane protein
MIKIKKKEMKNILRIIVLVCCANFVTAQQVPLTSQYMFNNYLLNPAEAGSVDYISASLSARSQWTGVEEAPNTQFFSIQSKLGKKMGIGGYVYKDETGPINEQGLQLSYSYHLSVTDASKISFSLAGLLFSHDINRAVFRPEEQDDDAINNLKVSSVSPDINFGVLYYTDNYKIGISSPQLLQNKIYASTVDEENNKLARHYYLFGEYKYEVNDKISVVPSTLVKYVSGAPFQVDINARGVYDEKYWFGVSYRYNNAIVALAGINYKNLSFGYAYDYTLTDVSSQTFGGHEIFLSLKIYKKAPVSSKKFD